MRSLAMSLMVAAGVLAALALPVSAQSQRGGAACINSLKNATPIVKLVACRGRTGACGCGPGFVSSCWPRCCKCVPC